MANKKEQYSSEFKAEVAFKALAQGNKNLETLSERYNVPVSLILVWSAQLEQNASHIYETTQEPAAADVVPASIDLEVIGVEVSNSLKQGVMSDNLNYKRLITWAVMGLILATVFVQMLIEIFKINIGRTPEVIAGEHAFYEVTTKKLEAHEKLSTFGVVDDSVGIYRVPIDMVIEQMAQEATSDSAGDLTAN